MLNVETAERRGQKGRILPHRRRSCEKTPAPALIHANCSPPATPPFFFTLSYLHVTFHQANESQLSLSGTSSSFPPPTSLSRHINLSLAASSSPPPRLLPSIPPSPNAGAVIATRPVHFRGRIKRIHREMGLGGVGGGEGHRQPFKGQLRRAPEPEPR